MKSISKYKGIILATVVLVLAVFLYNSFFKSDYGAIDPAAEARQAGEELLKTYEKLERVSLDENLFSSEGYLLLTDFSAPLETELIGRSNPFAALGSN